MNELKIFENKEFGKVRVQVIDDVAYFVAKDVCDVLKHTNSRTAISRLDDDEVRKVYITDSLGREQETSVINEMGLYSLILTSNIPKAKEFKRWITHEVIPSIRQNGGYIANQEQLSPEELMAQAVLVAQRVIADKDKQLETQAPKVLFADSVSASNTTILIGELAKILKQNGHEIGQNRLFEWLRNNNYLISRQGTDYNMPTQRAMDLKLFTIKETSITHADGHVSISKTVKVTGKGQVYFINKFNEVKECI